MQFDRILVVVIVIGLVEIVYAGIIHQRMPLYEEDEFDNIMDKLNDDLIDDEGDGNNDNGKPAKIKESKHLNDDTTTLLPLQETIKSDVLHLEVPKLSNATQVITSLYETIETPISPNMVVQKVQPSITATTMPTSELIFVTKNVEPEVTLMTSSVLPSALTTLLPQIATTKLTTSSTLEATTMICQNLTKERMQQQESDSFKSFSKIPIEQQIQQTDKPYIPIWVKIINGMRCSMRDCHGVLIPTEGYPTEELPTIPMTRFIRGESITVVPPCPCKGNH